jgi:hypothetical protein
MALNMTPLSFLRCNVRSARADGAPGPRPTGPVARRPPATGLPVGAPPRASAARASGGAVRILPARGPRPSPARVGGGRFPRTGLGRVGPCAGSSGPWAFGAPAKLGRCAAATRAALVRGVRATRAGCRGRAPLALHGANAASEYKTAAPGTRMCLRLCAEARPGRRATQAATGRRSRPRAGPGSRQHRDLVLYSESGAATRSRTCAWPPWRARAGAGEV